MQSKFADLIRINDKDVIKNEEMSDGRCLFDTKLSRPTCTLLEVFVIVYQRQSCGVEKQA